MIPERKSFMLRFVLIQTYFSQNNKKKSPSEIFTFGHYLRLYIRQAKAHGAIPIVLSHTPGNRWTGEKMDRCDETYGKWSKEVAEQEVNEVVEESIDNTEAEKVEPQVNGSEAQIQALTNKVEELEKVNTAMVARLEVLEQTLSKLAVEEPKGEDFGISGTGKTTQGVNEAKNEQKNLYKAMGFRG